MNCELNRFHKIYDLNFTSNTMRKIIEEKIDTKNISKSKMTVVSLQMNVYCKFQFNRFKIDCDDKNRSEVDAIIYSVDIDSSM